MNCIITPIKQFNNSFLRTINSIFGQTLDSWKWFIVNDSGVPIKNINGVIKLTQGESRVKIINNKYGRGAGNARNFALDLIQKKYRSCNLFFIDAGDEWNKSFLEDSIANLELYGVNIVSSSYLMQWKNGMQKKVIKSGTRTYKNMLKDYSTSCLSTALKIDDTSIFSKIRFGETVRVNDQPFFLSAVKYYGSVEQIKDIKATYHVGDSTSLSAKKIYTAIGKWRILKNQDLPLICRVYYFAFYFVNGFKKYYL